MIPLIRTEGKQFEEGPTLSPASLLGLPALRRASKSDVTRRVEAAFGLGDCLYFFAGHACPDFGDVVLVYDGDMADGDEGSATPFDTGGLHAGHVHYSSSHVESQAEYCKQHAQPLSSWRERAREYLEEHFESPSHYVEGAAPRMDDPSGRLKHPKNSRRAWTWEVRIHRDHPIGDSLRGVWFSEDFYEDLRREAGMAGAVLPPLLRSDKVVIAGSDVTPHFLAEQAVARWL